jgi:hypothetical protein
MVSVAAFAAWAGAEKPNHRQRWLLRAGRDRQWRIGCSNMPLARDNPFPMGIRERPGTDQQRTRGRPRQ